MNGRWFDERQLEAHIADGTEKFRKSKDKNVGGGPDEEKGGSGDGDGNGDVGDESERLDKFGKWLEEEGEKGGE